MGVEKFTDQPRKDFEEYFDTYEVGRSKKLSTPLPCSLAYQIII